MYTYVDNVLTFKLIIGLFTLMLKITVDKLYSSVCKFWYVVCYSEKGNTFENDIFLSIKYS